MVYTTFTDWYTQRRMYKLWCTFTSCRTWYDNCCYYNKTGLVRVNYPEVKVEIKKFGWWPLATSLYFFQWPLLKSQWPLASSW